MTHPGFPQSALQLDALIPGICHPKMTISTRSSNEKSSLFGGVGILVVQMYLDREEPAWV